MCAPSPIRPRSQPVPAQTMRRLRGGSGGQGERGRPPRNCLLEENNEAIAWRFWRAGRARPTAAQLPVGGRRCAPKRMVSGGDGLWGKRAGSVGGKRDGERGTDVSRGRQRGR